VYRICGDFYRIKKILKRHGRYISKIKSWEIPEIGNESLIDHLKSISRGEFFVVKVSLLSE